jgi:hypothetical protein
LALDPNRPAERLDPVSQAEQTRPTGRIGATDPVVTDLEQQTRVSPL